MSLSIENYCNKFQSVDNIYHIGDYLLLSHRPKDRTLTQIQSYDQSSTFFYAYNWRTGRLYHNVVDQGQLFNGNSYKSNKSKL